MRLAYCGFLLVLVALSAGAEENKRKVIDTLKGTGPAFADLRKAVRWQGVSLEQMIEKAGTPTTLEHHENGEVSVTYRYIGRDSPENTCSISFRFNQEGEIYRYGVSEISKSGSTAEPLCAGFPINIMGE